MSQDSDNNQNQNLPPTLEPAQPVLEESPHGDELRPQETEAPAGNSEHPAFGQEQMQSGWRSKLTSFTQRISVGARKAAGAMAAGQPGANKVVKGFDPETLLHGLQKTATSGALAPLGTALTILAGSWLLSDISGLMIGGLIPEPAPGRLARPGFQSSFDRSDDPISVITQRNLFSSQGIIPGEEATATASDPGGAPVKTTLPFNLVGTLILMDPTRSIATIEDKSASMVYPVRVDDEISGKARILEIEPRKVVFLNLSASRREFVEMPIDSTLANARISLSGASKTSGAPQVETVGNNQFNVARAAVDQALSDLPKVLTQARAVPNIENGVANGYKLFQIVPGSIYQTIGLQNGDTLMALDGNPMNDPGKAFELLNQLKTQSRMELTVKRNGKVQTFTYEIR
jgi:general secretion pathway protein C